MLDAAAPSLQSRKAKPSQIPEEQTLIGETDMPQVMQAHALRVASEALDSYCITDCKEIACYIKKVRYFNNVIASQGSVCNWSHST